MTSNYGDFHNWIFKWVYLKKVKSFSLVIALIYPRRQVVPSGPSSKTIPR